LVARDPIFGYKLDERDRNHALLLIRSSGRRHVEVNLNRERGRRRGLESIKVRQIRERGNEMTNLFLSTLAKVAGRLQIEAASGAGV